MTTLRKIARWGWVYPFFANHEWFRKLHGGKWVQAHVDSPVNATLWMPLSEGFPEEYRHPLWRGTPVFKDYDLP